ESLRALMEKSGSLPTDQVVPLIRKLADGMAYCHKNEVIHRDLKPENILITSEGQPVIMDFGLALTKDSHRVTYSNLSATMGTPDYMSPEQIEGQRGDQRSDIYALGTIMYEMLAGHTPFTGDTPMAVMAQHLNNNAPRLDKVNPSISVHLAAIVARCLARNPEDRYPDMDSLIAVLDTPETVDISILDKSSAPPKNSSLSLTAQQTIKGVLIAAGIIILLILLSLGLQTLRP
ncbi:MAG TPA: serine/threonine-protein kinase, partial [Anaerolineales bacterium]|nr:serine/threonine-protein kinase [Anaerolineales bacterium]